MPYKDRHCAAAVLSNRRGVDKYQAAHPDRVLASSRLFYKNNTQTEKIRVEEFRAKNPSWQSYHGMMQRCYNPNHQFYSRYGGRGISVCDSWRGSYVNFREDMGQRGKGYSIDRIDNDGNYELSNCRWATAKQQRGNRSAHN